MVGLQETKVDTSDFNPALLKEVQDFQSQFDVRVDKLNDSIKYFISELERGLRDGTDPTGIPMNTAWVLEYPTGQETGDFLAIDLGGTNLRIVMVHLLGNHKFETTQSKFQIPVPMRTTNDRNELFDFIAQCLEEFLTQENPNGIPEGKVYPLGFTFSYPATQDRIDMGVLQRWTKGFDINDVEGHDVVPLLMEKIDARKLPIRIDALINDTSGTLVASRYTDALTEMGCIFGTGVNGAYYDRIKNIPKLENKLYDDIKPDTPMLINCEYGSFDNAHKVLPRTYFDVLIDEQSPRPGQQTFEKMTSGYYLGELLRLMFVDLYSKGLIFKEYPADSETILHLKTPYILDSSFLSIIEADLTDDLLETFNLFNTKLEIDPTPQECKLSKILAQSIGTRAARLSVCGIAAACKKMGYTNCHIAADGSVFLKYPFFSERAHQALKEIYNWSDAECVNGEFPIKIVGAEDGSGVGAAIIAALSNKRKEANLSVGIKSNL
ncbi:unnamed protein product [[Candida] boidinii]|uniref:Phosphotransferase n=1 Tax=Candida boidinii TaxID=5477 RepID=A0A9W6WIW4_CANBO|nr:hypothetical protein BVG19_g2960 [[Candida] boidinii]OWB50423.1 hypothetical protein B5S27_g1973 [[Candida] boidinii]OWB66609.1 hypothetical protein B5S30_g1951 [[Candida] boidinii]OWB83884.1 hypothetical protein B5S33_g2519 [[Candida] boidinii]GME74380.1 unnamed protein product [[Candida] boidinii]